jgi:hypothetical protein
LWAAGAALFVVLATGNAAGYRFGVSDQAFYIPAITRALDPAAFPRDAALIDAQGKLLVVDTLIAGIVRITGVTLDTLFFALYLLSLLLIWTGLMSIATRVYRDRGGDGPPYWAMAALGAAFTLRHRITETSANSFEPYFHPRMLAFALGVLAIAAVLRRRWWTAVVLVGVAAIVHVTTAIWFAILIGVALATLDPLMRRLGIAAAAGSALVAAWALTTGPLAASMVRMDPVWLQAVAGKDSLFATAWPAWAWVANLGTTVALIALHRLRQRRGTATPEDDALVRGAIVLTVVFLATLPAIAARLAFPVQLQISRVFWLIDLLATVYLIAAIADPGRRRLDARRLTPIALVAAVLVAVSAGRAVYVITVEHPERSLFDLHLDQSPWQDAMRWLSRQPRDVHVLADPGHAWKYGTTVRVAAGRDVLLEEVKDAAIAMYSRDVALRVVERTRAIGDFPSITADRVRALATQYDLDYLVAEQPLALPIAYRNSRFFVYALRRR